MTFDTASTMIILITVLLTCVGLVIIYSDAIQSFFLRRVLYTTTRLIMYLQSSGDALYDLAWDKICECLDEVARDQNGRVMTIEEVFFSLFQRLDQHRRDQQYSSDNLRVIHRAIEIASLWKTSLKTEIQRTKSIDQLRVSIGKFSKIIKEIRP